MSWDVEYTDEFFGWWDTLGEAEQNSVLLLGGNKTGDDRWYERHIPLADRLYDDHLATLKDEGML